MAKAATFAAMKNQRVGRSDRLQVFAPYAQRSERVLDHGLARWEQLENQFLQMRERGYGEGFLVATDRRLFFFSEKQRKPSSFIYSRIKAHGVRKNRMTAELWLVMNDMQEATFTGGKGAYAAMNEYMSIADAHGAPDMEVAVVEYYPIGFRCGTCGFQMTAQWPYCPACARDIDWAGSEQATKQYNQRVEHEQQMRDSRG